MKSNDELILAEAAAWVDWTSRPDAEPQKADAFERWMEADAAHRAAFADLSALWRSDALGEALDGVADAPAATARRRDAAGSWRWAAPSALAVLAAAAGVALFAPWMDHRTIETGRAETRVVTLADGSVIEMNGATRLEVGQSPLRRSVRLARGEAYFDVRPGRRPFTVDMGAGQAQVLGTAFNIDRMASGRTEVALYRGAVRVRGRAGQPLDLAPGQRLVLQNGQMRRVSPVADDRPDWLAGWFDAEEATLERLAEEMDRFASKPIVIEGSARHVRISGRFRVAQPASVLRLISTAYDVEVRDEAGRTVIRHR